MKPKTYYLIVLIVCLAIVFSFAMDNLFLNDVWYKWVRIYRIRDVLALFIIYMQSSFSPKLVQRVIAVLAFLAVLGWIFAIQHLSYGRVLFIASFGISLCLLLADAWRKKGNRKLNVSLLLIPVLHFTGIAMIAYHMGSSFFIIEVIAMAWLSIVLVPELLKSTG
jgi:hypothetical protein